MQDTRRYKRLITEGMDIQCKMEFATEVELLNIGYGGASIILNRRLNMGDKYSLHIDHENSTILVKGVVLWERIVDSQTNERGEMVPIYEAGIRFDNVLTDKGAELINFIEKNFAPKHFKARLRGLRVEIIGPQKGIITDYHKSYYVLKISLGGMLLETDSQLEVGSKSRMELSLLEEKQSIKFPGRVASSLEVSGKVPKRYETGIEIIEMSEEDKPKLKEFIDTLQNLNK